MSAGRGTLRHVDHAAELARQAAVRHETPRSYGEPEPLGGGGVFLAVVSAVHDEYLEVRRWTGTEVTGDVFKVALPPLHRRSTWDGWTTADGWTFAWTAVGERTATKGALVETQKITPAWSLAAMNDLSLPIKVASVGPTGVTIGEGAEAETLVYEALSEDRRWAVDTHTWTPPEPAP